MAEMVTGAIGTRGVSQNLRINDFNISRVISKRRRKRSVPLKRGKKNG